MLTMDISPVLTREGNNLQLLTFLVKTELY